MYPYIKFFQPEEIGYTERMRKALTDEAQIESQYDNYVSPEGHMIELEFSVLFDLDRGIKMKDIPILQTMFDLIQPNITITASGFIRFLPGRHTVPHVDDSLARTTALTFPLTPEPKWFAPTIGFKPNSMKPETVMYWDGRPGLLNTRERHAVYNNKYPRHTFQICFREPLDDVLELHKHGKLFTSQLTGDK